MKTGAKLLVESLEAEGIETLFGIPGVDTLGVYDAFLDHPSIRAINVRHEQSAVFMADGFARSSGSISVALTSGGPGALNTVTAMATAYNDSSPVLHVMNENPAHVRRKGKGYFHDLQDQLGVFRPVSDFVVQATLADEIPAAINSAMYALRARRPRPAVVEIAGEALRDAASTEALRPVAVTPRSPDEAAVTTIAELIAASAAPMSLMIMKQQVYRHLNMPLGESMKETNRLMAESLERPDFREGVRSFIEKRPPEFTRLDLSGSS